MSDDNLPFQEQVLQEFWHKQTRDTRCELLKWVALLKVRTPPNWSPRQVRAAKLAALERVRMLKAKLDEPQPARRRHRR